MNSYSPYNMPVSDNNPHTMQGQSENQSHYSNTEAMGMSSNTGLTNHSSVERHHHQHHHHSHHVNIQPFEIPRVIPSLKAKKAKPERAGLRKAPGAPKRFKSSYILFFMAQQKEIKEELGEGASVGEISKRSSEKWKSLSQEERAVWDAKAEEDKERYNREKDKYTGPWQVPWKRAKKNPNAPKRPMSAFLFFSQTKRRSIKDANPGMRNTEISRVLGEMWKKASAEERAPHIEREAAEREKYKVAIAKWREEEAIRRREEVDEQKNKVLERAIDNGQSFQKTPKATLSTAQQRNSPLPFQGTSPLPIHESRSSSPGPNPPGSAPRYYPHGGYGYPVPNYGAPPPGYYPQSSYPPVQHSPQSQGYYSNYAPIPPVEYPHQRQYQEYPHPPPPPHSIPQVGNMDDHSRHFDHPLPVRYGGYYPPAPPNGSFNTVEGIPPSGSNAETEYSSEFPPQS